MSRFQYINRNLELLEPYEWKRSRTVLRGESSCKGADLPDRPSDLTQRDGRGVRARNETAKLHAGNKVDVIIYAVEKTLDAYKFGLLHNKQLFIRQLKTNNLGSRRIDEGGMDENGGMNFSEYVAILSGNTDLLEKARLDKKITTLESERQAFNRGKSSTRFKLEDIMRSVEGNNDMIERVSKDIEALKSRMQYAPDGTPLNPVQLDVLNSGKPKDIAEKLSEIAEKARTLGSHEKIGSLYGFDLYVKSETTQKDGFDMVQNRFSVRGEGQIYYHYNNGVLANDPKTAVQNFLNALTTMPQRILEKNQSEKDKVCKDIPALQEVLKDTWKKEDDLNALKSEREKLELRIEASLKSGTHGQGENKILSDNITPDSSKTANELTNKSQENVANDQNKTVPMPDNLENLKKFMGDKLIIASIDNGNKNTTDKNTGIRKNRGFKL